MTSWIKQGLFYAQDSLTNAMFGEETATKKTSFYDCVDKDMEGKDVSMRKFSGDVVIVVNVASQ